MNAQIKPIQEECVNCFKIKCKNCGWEPNGEELTEVLAGKLTNCPDCGSLK
jgi:NAD-dependent SIR2 family protein deacetylase